MATNSKQVKPLDIPFKEFTPGQVIQSVQFNDDMLDIEDKVNELVNEHNIVSDEIDSHTSNLDNPHQVDAHQTGTYYGEEIDEFFQDVKSGNLNDNAITNRVLDDDCITARNIVDNTITVSKIDANLGHQLDISQNIEIATRYTKEETDNLIQDKVGNGTYSKEELDVKFEEIQAGVIVDSTIGIEKLKEDVGTKLNIGSNINILNKYTKDEVDYLIRCNALPRDWGSILGDDEVEPFFDTKNGIFPVADFMIADKFVTSNDNILDFEIREVVDSRGEYETLNDRLNVYDTIKPEINEELEVISNKINDNQNINTEEHNTINSKVLDNKNSISSLNTKVSNLENTTSTQGNKISSLERRSDTLESRSSALESADRGINVKISNVENRLGSIDSLNNTQTSKINALENRANTTDSNISNINSNINSVKTDLNNVKSDLNTVKTDLNNVGQIVNENIEPIRTELSQVVTKNNEQDNRLYSLENDLNCLPDVISNHNDLLKKHESDINDIKYVNKRQDVMLGGLFNENADGRLSLEGTGNDVKLEGSKDGLVEVKNVVGNTLVNCIKDGEKEFILNGDIDESGTSVKLTEAVDNGQVDVLAEGNTLVNLANNNALRTPTKYLFLDNGYITYKTDGVGYMDHIYLNKDQFKHSTTYTIILDIKSNTFDKEITLIANSDTFISSYKNPIPAKATGIKTIKFETKSDFSNAPYGVFINGGSTDGTGNIVFRTMILEGDWTNRELPSYFEGMKSVGELEENKIEILSRKDYITRRMIPYHSQRKPIFNFKDAPSDDEASSSELEPFLKHFNNCGSYDSCNNLFDYYRVSEGYWVNLGVWGITPEDCEEAQNVINKHIGEHEGHKKQIILNEPLRAVGDSKDRFVQIDSKWYVERNCAEVVLDGNISYCKVDSHSTNTECYYIEILDYDNIIMDNAGQCISEKFAYNGNFDANTNIPSYSICTIYTVHKLRFLIPKSQISSADRVGVNNYFANNPTKVIVKLASPTYEPVEIAPTLNTYTDVTHISNNSTIPMTMNVKNSGYECILKPNTKYTVLGVDSGRIGSSTILNGTITTPATIDDNVLRPYGTGKCGNVMLLEGTYSKELLPSNYFSGLKSSFEDGLITDENNPNFGKYKAEVKVVGKNKVINCDLDFNPRTGNNIIQYFSFKKGTTYSLNIFDMVNNGSSIIQIGIKEMNNDSYWVGLALANDLKTFTLSEDKECYLTVFKHGIGDTSNIKVKIQLEEGTVATPYEPYKEYVQTLYLDEPLYKDNELCVHDGKLGYWKNWDKVVLDGSDDEDWAVSGSQDATYTRRYNTRNGALKNGCGIRNTSINDVFQNNNKVFGSVDYECASNYDDNNFYIKVSRAKAQDVSGFKQYLSENPVTVVYQLAEPIFVQILENTPQWVLESFNDCSIHFNSNIPITSSSLSYTGNVPSVYSMQRTNQIQDDLIDVSLMATDEMFMMLEPLLCAIPQVINEKGNSKMVDMYVAMVMRGLKTIEEIPARYREEVKKVLDKLEK